MRFVRVYMRSLHVLWSEERGLTLALAIASLGVGWIQVVEPVLFGRVIDAMARPTNAYRLLVFWGGLGVLNIGASVFLAVMSDRLAHRQRLGILDQVFERVIQLPVSYHSEKGSGRVVRAILTGTDQLFTLWLGFMREQLSSLIGVAFLVPLALTMDRRMAGLLFVLAVVYMVANFVIHKRTHSRQERVEQFHQDLFGRVGDVIGNVTVVQSYTRLLDEVRGLQNIMGQLLNAQYPILTWWGILTIITRLSSTITLVAILSLGCLLVSQGQLTAGQVVAFASFSTLLIGKLEQISAFLSRTVSQTPALQNFFDLLDNQPNAALEIPNARQVPPGGRGEVKFENVTYRYKDSPYGIFDVDFTAEAGQTVALVGPSGSGKTTSLALLQRLFDPQIGSIMLDGVDIREYTLASLRSVIATVFQDAGLFNRSIAENIRVGRPSATDAEVEEAARKADAHAFISGKPGGYEFIIGERGAALSGGERQRIAIARAILKNAPVLIFDEATSALDNQTEKRIQSAIANLRVEEKTTFIIAHRLSTVMTADKILVFEKGRIIEAGTFEELRTRGGLFSQLVQAGELTTKTPAEASL